MLRDKLQLELYQWQVSFDMIHQGNMFHREWRPLMAYSLGCSTKHSALFPISAFRYSASPNNEIARHRPDALNVHKYWFCRSYSPKSRNKTSASKLYDLFIYRNKFNFQILKNLSFSARQIFLVTKNYVFTSRQGCFWRFKKYELVVTTKFFFSWAKTSLTTREKVSFYHEKWVDRDDKLFSWIFEIFSCE